MARSADEMVPRPAARPPRNPTAAGSAGDGSASRALPGLLLGGGLVGLLAAFVLTVERIALLADPDYVPTCSINPVLSCGSVMATPQAEAFGFPNPLLGIVGFTAVVSTGAALLAGARFHRWYWLGLQAGVTLGAVFAHWLIFQSLYRINALCPYCMAVWAVTIPIFWYVTLHNASTGAVPLRGRVRSTVAVMSRYHGVALTVWFVAVAALIAQRFWTYWSLLLTPDR